MEHVQEVDGRAEAEGRRLLTAAFETGRDGGRRLRGRRIGRRGAAAPGAAADLAAAARTRALVPAGAVDGAGRGGRGWRRR